MNHWTVIVATRNRAPDIAETLRRIPAPGGCVKEVIVVDNGSSDGSALAAERAWPGAQVLRLNRNLGPAGKQLALERAKFPLVAAIDDDCSPAAWTWAEMANRFAADPKLACAGWGVQLTDGRWECGALPRAFVGAAVAFRRDAIVAAGGYRRRLFMQAEEYDIVFRLAMRGGRCETFHDLPSLHRKSPLSRSGRRTTYLDARNNIAIIRRWAPFEWSREMTKDYITRYLALGRARGAAPSAAKGVRDGLCARWLGGGEPLPRALFNEWFGVERISNAFQQMRDHGVRRVLLAPMGKNIFVYWRAAERMGIEVAAVADDRFHAAGVRRYRSAPLVTGDEAMSLGFDAVVVSNSAPIFAAEERDRWQARVGVEVWAPEAIEGGGAARYVDAPIAA